MYQKKLITDGGFGYSVINIVTNEEYDRGYSYRGAIKECNRLNRELRQNNRKCK